jgi:hypothetical protein
MAKTQLQMGYRQDRTGVRNIPDILDIDDPVIN